jgi:hypothetical protein
MNVCSPDSGILETVTQRSVMVVEHFSGNVNMRLNRKTQEMPSVMQTTADTVHTTRSMKIDQMPQATLEFSIELMHRDHSLIMTRIIKCLNREQYYHNPISHPLHQSIQSFPYHHPLPRLLPSLSRRSPSKISLCSLSSRSFVPTSRSTSSTSASL